MKPLSESQTELIINWVKSHHLSINSLENEFVDHICCDVEKLMGEGKSFKAAFESLRFEIGDETLTGIEKQTILKLTYNQRLMKSITNLTGILALFIFFAAIILRAFGVELWSSLMGGGMLLLGLGFAPLYFIGHYNQQEVKGHKVLHIFGFLAAFLIPIGAFLGLFNSPYSLGIVIIGILFLLFGFLPLSWLSVSRGSGRTIFTGSIIFLLFFVFMSYGFLGLRISKDMVNSWVFISNSAESSAQSIEKLNKDCYKKIQADSAAFAIASEVLRKSDVLVQNITGLRDYFIMELSAAPRSPQGFFKGMDDHFAGQRLLIRNNSTDKVLQETSDYRNLLLALLSEENELVKQKINTLLASDSMEDLSDLQAQKNYLFRDFPAVVDVSILNSMVLNVRIAEYQTLKYLSEKALI